MSEASLADLAIRVIEFQLAWFRAAGLVCAGIGASLFVVTAGAVARLIAREAGGVISRR